MMDPYALGQDEFARVFAEELAMFEPGVTPRSAGRPTKILPNGEDDAWWRENGPQFVKGYVTWRQTNPNLHLWTTPDGQPAIELKVEALVTDTDGDQVILRGYIDRVFQDANTGDLSVFDLKFGKMVPNPLQLAFYRRSLKATYDVDARWGMYFMGRNQSVAAVEDLSAYSDDMIDYWVATTYRGIKHQVFLPNVSQYCRGCGVREACYVFNEKVLFQPFNVTDIQEGSEGAHV